MTSRSPSRARSLGVLGVATALAVACALPTVANGDAAFNQSGVEGNVFKPSQQQRSTALAAPTTAAAVSIPPSFPAIDINSQADAAGIRSQLIDYIWKGAGFPTATPAKVTTGITDSDFSDIASLASIDRLDVNEEYGVQTYEYLFHAKSPLNQLVIYHAGHEGTFRVHKADVQYFLDRGYDVLALSMPLVVDSSPTPFDYWRPHIRDFGNISLFSHYYIPLVETSSFSGIKYFVEPVAEGLNYALGKTPYTQVGMVGISGGGWTTTLYAALDPRVKKSYPVAGSLPFFLRWDYNPGDWEQMTPGLYHVADYLELYILDAANGTARHSIQILNSADPCCFSGATYKQGPYEPTLDNVMANAGIDGSFDVYIDNNADHSISPNALSVIAADLAL